MNHNKIYVYNNDTQRNISMKHAATISLLNLYPKIPSGCLSIIYAQYMQIGKRQPSNRQKTKRDTFFQQWRTHTSRLFLVCVRASHYGYVSHEMLGASHESYRDCSSIMDTKTYCIIRVPLASKRSSRATREITFAVPTASGQNLRIAYRLRFMPAKLQRSIIECAINE